MLIIMLSGKSFFKRFLQKDAFFYSYNEETMGESIISLYPAPHVACKKANTGN